jgi:hypothetical protein
LIVNRRRLVVLLAAGFAVVATCAPHFAAQADSPSVAPVFTHPVWVDAQRNAAEPDITIGNDGRYYVSAPWGVSTNTSFIWRSEDGGTQFRQIQGTPGFQNPYNFRAGGDTEIKAFPPAGNALSPGESAANPSTLYFMNQDNLDSQTCGLSTNAGRSFSFIDTSQPGQGAVCGGTVGADRQWIAETRVDPTVSANNGVLNHDINYLWYDHYQVGGNTLGRSNDGITYTLGPSNQGGGNPGNIVADRNSGVVYFTTSIGGGAYVAYSADGGKTANQMNITGGVDGGCAGGTGTDFSVIAIDTAGNLYLVYSCQNGLAPWRVYFSHTTGFTSVNVTMDNAATRAVNVASGWTLPVPITGPLTDAASSINYAVFPWITAGDPGRVDVAFYGTTQATGYDPSSQPAQWNTYVLQDFNYFAFDTNIPPCLPPGCPPPPPSTAHLVAVSEGPTHLSSICFNGIGCTGTGNRNLLDFFEVTHDANGMAVVVYNDDANTMTAAFPGGPFDMVGRQVGGPSLYAAIGSLPGTAPPDTNFVTDPSGDGMYPTSDVNVPSLDLLQTSATLKDPNTLEVGFTVSSLKNIVSQIPAAEGGIGVTYVLVWKYLDDVWFASARIDASGTFTFWAGRPQSVPFTATGGPKYGVYDAGTNATQVTGTPDTTNGTITIDVPTSLLGGLATGSRMIDATGFSLVDRAAGAGSVTPALADGADVTQAFDDKLAVAPVGVPEAPWLPAVVLVGAGLIAATAVRRRRRPA